MSTKNATTEADLVRCLECRMIYNQPRANTESRACPNCGYVGWTNVSIEERRLRARR